MRTSIAADAQTINFDLNCQLLANGFRYKLRDYPGNVIASFAH